MTFIWVSMKSNDTKPVTAEIFKKLNWLNLTYDIWHAIVCNNTTATYEGPSQLPRSKLSSLTLNFEFICPLARSRTLIWKISLKMYDWLQALVAHSGRATITTCLVLFKCFSLFLTSIAVRGICILLYICSNNFYFI